MKRKTVRDYKNFKEMLHIFNVNREKAQEYVSKFGYHIAPGLNSDYTFCINDDNLNCVGYINNMKEIDSIQWL